MNNALIAVLLVGFATNPTPAADKPANSEQIGKLLKEMGYDPQALSDDVWQVSVDRDNWKVHIMVALTREGDRVWLECKFAPIAEPAVVPASAWLKLLEENERISPAHFAFDKSDKRVHLYKAFDNANVTVVRLKKELEAFDAVVRRTQGLWRSENFAPIETLLVLPREKGNDKFEELSIPPRDAAKEPQAALQGKWRIVRIEMRRQSVTEERLVGDPYLSIDGNKARLKIDDAERTLTIRVDSSEKPAQIDFIDRRGTERGIYQFDRDLLRICIARDGADRPKQFATMPDGKTWLLILKKEEDD